MHKGSTNYWLFLCSFWSLNRGGELLLLMKAWVTEADVLLKASQVSGLFLDFQGQRHLHEMAWSSLFCP